MKHQAFKTLNQVDAIGIDGDHVEIFDLYKMIIWRFGIP
jgi:hypothetical protein